MEPRELSLPADGQHLPTPEEVALLQRIWQLYRFGVPDLSEKDERDRLRAGAV